jgi:hypothetical protein
MGQKCDRRHRALIFTFTDPSKLLFWLNTRFEALTVTMKATVSEHLTASLVSAGVRGLFRTGLIERCTSDVSTNALGASTK